MKKLDEEVIDIGREFQILGPWREISEGERGADSVLKVEKPDLLTYPKLQTFSHFKMLRKNINWVKMKVKHIN